MTVPAALFMYGYLLSDTDGEKAWYKHLAAELADMVSNPSTPPRLTAIGTR
jgi:hypothetical protein